MGYYQIRFVETSPAKQEILIAALSESGYDGFEQMDNELLAFIPENDFDYIFLDACAIKYLVSYTKEFIADKNWNAVWESNFPPVVVDKIAGIRAEFHPAITGVKHEIIITPKMSFGTGHHATTLLMIRGMDELQFAEKNVLDFGTGTGILAILAEKMGASAVTAIDYDEWSIENAAENIQNNACKKILLSKQDSAEGKNSYGIILANINRNVITDNLLLMKDQLAPGGDLLLSGLLVADEKLVNEKAVEAGLKFVKRSELNGWIGLRFSG